MTTYKTMSGLMKATERTIEELGSTKIEDDREYNRMSRKVDNLLGQLRALWSNPADVTDTDKVRCRLVDAWNNATM